MEEKSSRQIIAGMVIKCFKQIVVHQDIKFNPDKAKEYFLKTEGERYPQILETVRKDMEAADFLGGLKRKKPVVHALVNTAMNISLTHACTMYAKDCLEYCKTTDQVIK